MSAQQQQQQQRAREHAKRPLEDWSVVRAAIAEAAVDGEGGPRKRRQPQPQHQQPQQHHQQVQGLAEAEPPSANPAAEKVQAVAAKLRKVQEQFEEASRKRVEAARQVGPYLGPLVPSHVPGEYYMPPARPRLHL